MTVKRIGEGFLGFKPSKVRWEPGARGTPGTARTCFKPSKVRWERVEVNPIAILTYEGFKPSKVRWEHRQAEERAPKTSAF